VVSGELSRTSAPFYSGQRIVFYVGSYAGTLAAVFCFNEPNAFFGSVAGAAPVRGFGNSSNPATSDFHTWASFQVSC
jgi:hypothetical protein